MKVLFTCIPGFGHFHPMVPLAQSLRRAGHQVAFASAGPFCQRVVEPAGFTAFSAGLSQIEVHERMTELAALDGLAEGDVWRFGVRLFAEVMAPAKVPDLVKVIDEWHADLVVHDMTDFAGPIAATASGIPCANHSFGALQPEEFWDLAGEVVAPTWAAWKVEPGPLGGMFRSLYLDICPSAFQSAMVSRVPTRQGLRPVTFDNPRGETLPPWFEAMPAMPNVYVTLGTVANHTPEVFETVLAGLADQPANVVMTVGPDRDPAELGPLPANVHVERYLPQSLIFPRCDLVVCHGGSGTTLAALAAGLPQLVLPQEANQFWNADRIAALGAGRQIRPEELTAEVVGSAVVRVLGDMAYRNQARRLAAEIAAMPGPDEVVRRLEELAARRSKI